jgi:CBS domain-containing protein
MALIGEIVSSPVKTVRADASIAAAAQKMREEHIGSLVVVDEEGRFVGMVTDRDIVLRLVAENGDAESTVVDRVATHDVAALPVTASIDEAMDLMRRRIVRRVPVVDDGGHPVGILSLEDLAASEYVTDAELRAMFHEIAVAYRAHTSHVIHGH